MKHNLRRTTITDGPQMDTSKVDSDINTYTLILFIHRFVGYDVECVLVFMITSLMKCQLCCQNLTVYTMSLNCQQTC